VYTQPARPDFYIASPTELYATLCDTEKTGPFSTDEVKYPPRDGRDHPLVKYLFPNGPNGGLHQDLLDLYSRLNATNVSISEIYWLKTWVGIIRSMKLREREKRLKERETKRLRERVCYIYIAHHNYEFICMAWHDGYRNKKRWRKQRTTKLNVSGTKICMHGMLIPLQ
jgi:hypothetical protein